jgi:hypothetical protein
MNDEYEPVANREREPKSRIHEELPPIARERLAETTVRPGNDKKAQQERRKKAFRETAKLVGRSAVYGYMKEKGKYKISHYNFVHQADTIPVLNYIEQLYSIRRRNGRTKEEQLDESGPIEDHYLFGGIHDSLVTEGVLWKIEWAGKGGGIQFVPIESESIEEMDTQVQALAADQPWTNPLRGYNAAFELYLAGDFNENIPKKLYNSVEAVLQTICVDLEGWTEDRDLSHQKYLNMLRDHNVYDANGITAPELESLLDALQKLVNKLGNDRKQRHNYIDREYCTLLIHQTGAYLYFLINRYEAFRTQ